MWQKRWPAQGQFIFMRLSKEEYRLYFIEDHPDLFQMMPDEMLYNAKAFGLSLKSWRLAKKMSLKKLSRITGVHRSNLCAMEHGRRKISEKTAERLVGLLKFSKVDELARQSNDDAA